MLLQLVTGPKGPAHAKTPETEKSAGLTPEEIVRKQAEASRAIEALAKAPKLPDRPVTTTEHLGAHQHENNVSCNATATKVDGKVTKIEESCTDGKKDSWSLFSVGRFGLHSWWNSEIKKK